MSGRTYAGQDSCPVARTLDVVGDRWTVLILRDLSFGARRFVDLERSLPGMAPNLLAARLKALVANGMVEREAYSERPPRSHYVLTAKGRGFVPVLRALAAYGQRWEPRRGRRVSQM
jgi:DNA-binding HxlR family transcriptional regulator